MTLFRPAALEGQRRGLHGEVTIHQPVTFLTLTSLFLVLTMLTVASLSMMTFSRKETATGWIVPELGMAEAYAPPGSIIAAVGVRLGQSVRRGQGLISVSTETYGASGALSQQERRQVAAQMSEIDTQVVSARQRRQSETAKVRDQLNSTRSTLAILQTQKQLQTSQLELASKQFRSAAPLVEKGFISKFDQDRREQAILSLKQAVSSLDQQMQAQEAQLAGLRAEIERVGTQQAIDESQLRASRSNLAASEAGIDARSGAVLRAPIDGVVAAVNTRAGETAKPGLPLVSIAPPGPLVAEFLLPTRAAGFVRAGQKVRILVDAFPFQRFGALSGTVEQISSASVDPGEYAAPIKFSEASYRVRVRLTAQGAAETAILRRLRPGMTLTGNIVTEKRTILQWLFDPILGARRIFEA